MHCLQDRRRGVGILLRHDDHGAERQQQVCSHDHDRAPEEIAGDRPPVLDLHSHVERDFNSKQRQDHQSIEGGVAAVQAEGGRGKVIGGRVPTEQPGDPGQAHRGDGGAIDDEDHVDQVLGHAEAKDRQHGADPDHQHDDDALLPWLLQPAAVQKLEHCDYQIGGGDHDQDARPPGAETRKEAPEVAQRFVRPDVDRALAGEHEAELSGDDRSRNQEGDEPEDPVDEAGRPSGLDDRALVREEDDRHKDRDHVERSQDLGQNAGRNPLGQQLTWRGRTLSSRHVVPPNNQTDV